MSFPIDVWSGGRVWYRGSWWPLCVSGGLSGALQVWTSMNDLGRSRSLCSGYFGGDIDEVLDTRLRHVACN